MTKLYAVITAVDLTDELNPIFEYQLTDDEEETGEISITDKISLATADYINRFEPESTSAFRKMITAICHYEADQLAGSEFES